MLLLILIGSAAAAESGTFNLSHFRENDNLFTIDVNKDSGAAFIETAKSSPYPVYRLWIEYTGTKFNYTTSITFHVDGTDFTFSDVSNADRILGLSNGDASEDMLIIFDGDNLSFLAALENNLTSVMEDENWMKNGVPEEKRARMTLHGIKDIEVTLDDGFYFDFLLFKGGMFNGGGYSSLFDTSGAPMEETAPPKHGHGHRPESGPGLGTSLSPGPFPICASDAPRPAMANWTRGLFLCIMNCCGTFRR